MVQKLTCIQAYKAVLHFLDFIYFTTYDDNLGSILGGAALYSNISGQKPQTMDPATFNKWMDSIKIVIDDDTITYKSQIMLEQAYESMHQYFIYYCDLGAEPSIFTLRDLLGEDFNYSDITRWLEQKWIKSIEYILQEIHKEKIGHLFVDKTRLTNHESFFVLQMFLDNFCKRNDNFDLIQLVQNSRLNDKSDIYSGIPDIIEPKIWNVWQNAINIAAEQEKDKTLNLLSAYKAVPIFLANYFGDNKSKFIDKVINKFEIDENNKPVNFAYWSSWTSTVVDINAQQMELINNLISIYSSISKDIAYKIIEEWLHYQKDLIGIDIVQQVLANTQGMQQVIDEIKQQPRSYLLLDDEITILETYHIMLKLLEMHGEVFSELAIDEKGKPVDFAILLEWIRICEQVIKL